MKSKSDTALKKPFQLSFPILSLVYCRDFVLGSIF